MVLAQPPPYGGRVQPWPEQMTGVLTLPSGRRVRGRATRDRAPAEETPDFALRLGWSQPEPTPWPLRWLRWADFGLPADRADAYDALSEAWRRAAEVRVEVTCRGGTGRTGTALGCLAVLDGVPAAEAVAYVRRHYRRHAAETPGQRRYVRHFPRATAPD